MIALLLILGTATWVIVVIHLGKRLSGWFGMTPHARTIRAALFLVLLVLPVADELIGRWQFYRLCEREARATLSPLWQEVIRAHRSSAPRKELSGYVIPVYATVADYIDSDSGKVFLTVPHFYTYGGLLMGRLGLGLGTMTSCHPEDIRSIQKQINLSSLLERRPTQ